jgi:antitoxin CptB
MSFEPRPQSEPRENRIKRMRMRSMRRGTKEMDILMMRFADAHLQDLGDVDLDLYDAVLSENDQDLYQWVTGQSPAPVAIAPMIARIAAAADENPVSKNPF